MIEATIILFLSISISVKMGTTLPYCETCRRWCGLGKRLFSTPPGEPAILKERLESKDFTYLISLGPDKKPLPSNWFEVFLHSCDRCQALHALTVNAVRLETNKKGRQQRRERAIVNKLLLSPKELQALISLKDQYLARAATTLAASPPPPPTASQDEIGSTEASITETGDR